MTPTTTFDTASAPVAALGRALAIRLSAKSPRLARHFDDCLVGVDHPQGRFLLICITPEAEDGMHRHQRRIERILRKSYPAGAGWGLTIEGPDAARALRAQLREGH